METADRAKRMLDEIEREHKKGKMDDGVYRMLKGKYQAVLRGVGEEVEAEEAAPKARRLPPHATAEDVVALANGLLADVRGLKQEITVLGVEKDSAERTLEGLKGKLDEGSINKSSFSELSEQYSSKVSGADAQITEKQDEIKRIEERLERMKKDLKRKIDKFTKAQQEIEKKTGVSRCGKI